PGQAQVVDPEDPALGLHECRRGLIGGSGYDGSEKFRHGLDLEHLAFREGNSAGGTEAGGHAPRFPLIKLQQRRAGTPAGRGLGNDLVRRTLPAKARARGLEQFANAFRFTQRQCLYLAERVVQAEFVPNAALEGRGTNRKGARWRRGTPLDPPAV